MGWVTSTCDEDHSARLLLPSWGQLWTSCWFPEHQRINYAESWSHVFSSDYSTNLKSLTPSLKNQLIGKDFPNNTSHWSHIGFFSSGAAIPMILVWSGRETVQDCTLSLIYLFWMYSVLVILPRLYGRWLRRGYVVGPLPTYSLSHRVLIFLEMKQG